MKQIIVNFETELKENNRRCNLAMFNIMKFNNIKNSLVMSVCVCVHIRCVDVAIGQTLVKYLMRTFYLQEGPGLCLNSDSFALLLTINPIVRGGDSYSRKIVLLSPL